MNRPILFLFLLISSSLYAEDSWKVLLLQPRYDRSLEDIAVPFITQLHAEFGRYDQHLLSSEEIDFRKKEQFSSQEETLYSALNLLIEQRDNMIFAKNDAVAIDSKNQAIKTKREEISELSFEDIQIPEIQNLEILSASEATPLYVNDPDKWPDDTDWILGSRFIDLGDFFILELWSRHKGSAMRTPLFRTRGSKDQLESLLKMARESCVSSLLGRDWSSVTIKAQPVNTSIARGDELVGIGEITLPMETPGSLELKFKASGFIGQTRVLELLPGDNGIYKITLEPGISRTSFIDSNPSGADVFLGSKWMGTTPLELVLPNENLSLLLQYPDYRQYYLPSDSLDEKMIIDMLPLGEDWEEVLEIKKNKYYNSLAAFTLSLIFPIVMQGITENRAALYHSYEDTYLEDETMENYQKAVDAFDSWQTSYNTYGVAIGCSSVFLAFNLYRLADYIKTSERSILEE